MPFSTITDGLLFPEGPLPLDDGSVLVVEIAGRTLTRIDPGGGKEIVAHLGGGPNGAALGPDGRCYVCNNGGLDFTRHPEHGLRPFRQAWDYGGGWIEAVDLATGDVDVLYRNCGDQPLRGPNDLVFDTHGGFYFTDRGKVRSRDTDRGALYYATTDGWTIREVASPLFSPNGIGLSPDGETLYVTESEPARLWAYPIIGPGILELEPWPSPTGGHHILTPGGTIYHRFDGLAVEADGTIAIGTLIHGGITRIHPEGKAFEHHPFPDLYVTNIAFGGADLRTAFITLSGAGKLIAVDWPAEGAGTIVP